MVDLPSFRGPYASENQMGFHQFHNRFWNRPIHSMVRIPHEAVQFLWECRSQETPGLLRLPRHKHLQRLARSSRTWGTSHVISATCQHLNSPCTSAPRQSPIIHIVSPICFGKHPSQDPRQALFSTIERRNCLSHR